MSDGEKLQNNESEENGTIERIKFQETCNCNRIITISVVILCVVVGYRPTVKEEISNVVAMKQKQGNESERLTVDVTFQLLYYSHNKPGRIAILLEVGSTAISPLVETVPENGPTHAHTTRDHDPKRPETKISRRVEIVFDLLTPSLDLLTDSSNLSVLPASLIRTIDSTRKCFFLSKTN